MKKSVAAKWLTHVVDDDDGPCVERRRREMTSSVEEAILDATKEGLFGCYEMKCERKFSERLFLSAEVVVMNGSLPSDRRVTSWDLRFRFHCHLNRFSFFIFFFCFKSFTITAWNRQAAEESLNSPFMIISSTKVHWRWKCGTKKEVWGGGGRRNCD